MAYSNQNYIYSYLPVETLVNVDKEVIDSAPLKAGCTLERFLTYENNLRYPHLVRHRSWKHNH
jgi:hypothetical protein